MMGVLELQAEVNPKPFVVPELKTWTGAEGMFAPSGRIAVKGGDKELMRIAQAFAADYELLTCRTLKVEKGSGKAGDFVLALNKKDATLGAEGYKLEIADKAVALIEPNSCVFIDGGSTTTYFARALPDDNYYVLTNSVPIAETILNKVKPTVTLLGGDLKKNHFITVGKTCRDFIAGINIQTAVMTATGFVKDTGSFTCGSQSEAEVKRAVIEKADLVIMLLDSSKVNKKTPYTFANLLDVDYMVVDNEFPEELKNAIISKGMKVY
jgi:DeoR/GlpR family transcriptional regulator of sugar metabolism